MKHTCVLLLFLLGFSLSAFSQGGTYTTYATTWNNLPRQYAVYVPATLPANPPMVFFLHGTAANGAVPPYQMVPQWELMARQNQFVMVWPISTFEPRASQWYWDAYDLDFSFTSPPDDSGFLRNLISTLTTAYAVNPKAVFVAGMSSGAMMTERVGVEISDLVAAIAPVSGPLYMKQITDCFTPLTPAAPISVLELHGDADPLLPYCGQSPKSLWGETGLTLASVDQTVNYWMQANACTNYVAQSLCANSAPAAGVNGQDATGCNGGVEVKFVREVGVGHAWLPTSFATVWQFFAAHQKP